MKVGLKGIQMEMLGSTPTGAARVESRWTGSSYRARGMGLGVPLREGGGCVGTGFEWLGGEEGDGDRGPGWN